MPSTDGEKKTMSDPKESSKFAVKALLYRQAYSKELPINFLYEAYKDFIDLQLMRIAGKQKIPDHLKVFYDNNASLKTLTLIQGCVDNTLSEKLLLDLLEETSDVFRHYIIQMVITHSTGITMLCGSYGPPASAGSPGSSCNLFDVYGNEITDTYVAPATDNLVDFTAKQKCYPINVDPSLKDILDYFHRM